MNEYTDKLIMTELLTNKSIIEVLEINNIHPEIIEEVIQVLNINLLMKKTILEQFNK